MTLNTLLHQAINIFFNSRAHQFWFMQLMYWFGFSVISFLSLSLWYAEGDLGQIIHILLQSIQGLILSLLLHWLFSSIWKKPLTFRFIISLLGSIFIATIWTFTRIFTLTLLIESNDLWDQLGGWYFSSIFVFLCWSALYYGINYYQLLQVEQKRSLKAENFAKESQLKMLRYQLNPHFLFNTLNAISALIQLDEASKAQEMIQQLSSFLRYSLDADSIKPITLNDEIHLLNQYLSIEKVRFAERLETHFSLCEKAKTALIPSLLLQPLVENSIKYAIAMNEKGGNIHISAKVENHTLHITVSDTGPSDNAIKYGNDEHKRRGVGLRNISERLAVLYPNKHEFTLSPFEPKGLSVSIRIPYQTHPTVQTP